MGGKTFYWDTNIFIAWLINEKREADEIAGIEAHVEAIDQGKAHLVTSVITLTEVLEVGVTREKRDYFKRLFQRERCHLVDVNSEIAELAHDIRVSAQQTGRKIKTPDAIHMATAIFFGCPTFYTFDAALLFSSIEVNGKLLILDKPRPSQYRLL